MPAEKLRIAFATPEFVTESYFDGGLANYLNRVSRILAAAGHDVHIVTLSLKDETEFEFDRVMVHRVMLKGGWQFLNRLTRYSLPVTSHWLNFSTQVYRKLKQLHRQSPFHLIQYPNYSLCGVFSIPLLRATHVIRASSYEPAWNMASGIKRNLDVALVERLEAWQYRLTHNVYAPSKAMQSMLAKNAGVSNSRVIRTPFYVETSDWDHSVYDQFLSDKQYVLYFGRFQLHKGFHTLARALPSFLDRYPEAYIALVGRNMETTLASSMAAFVRAQCGSVAERVAVLGNLKHTQLYPVIAGARLVALPSLVDNLPNACLEAMGLGKVVIGTKDASFEELITDGVNGFLVPANDPDTLGEKMIAAWIDPRLNEMGTAAKERMLEFAPEKTVASLLSYYAELLNGQA